MYKQLLLMFSFLLMLMFSFAQQSNLTINTTGNSNLKIIFAGKKYSLQDRSCTFQNLNPGVYVLTVYQLQNKQGLFNYEKVYDGNVTLTAGRHLEITILRFGKAVWDDGEIVSDEWNENYQNPQNGGGFGGSNDGRTTADAEQFGKIKRAINNEYTEDNKLRMAKVAIKDAWISTTQIKEIMNLFYVESNKLEIAKYAYNSCSDKGNYYTLTEVFYSSSSKNALLDYISGK